MSKEAMKLALEALEVINSSDDDRAFLNSDECEAIWVASDALREALADHTEQHLEMVEQPAQQQQEPACDDDVCVDCGMEHCECGEKDD